jgi:methyltransferase (TIGR00027 family)
VAVDETGARRVDTASTAEGAALLRAAGAHEPDPRVRNPDWMAARFVAWGLRLPALVRVPGLRRLVPRIVERQVPGAYYFETARTHHLDALVREAAGSGVAQLVLLGAGYDSRPYRMADELRDARVFEVDLPALSRRKRAKVRGIVGEPPGNVTYVEVDFTTQGLGERLAAHGHDRDAPTLYVWSGVAPYLPEEAVREVLSFVAAHGSPRTAIAFDYVFREVVEGDDAYYGAPELLARLRRMREPLRSGIPRGGAAAYLSEVGLRLEKDLGPQEAIERYLIRSDGSVYGRPYGFGGFALARSASLAS